MRVVLLTSVAVATLSLMPALANAQGAGGGERGGAAEKAPGRAGEGGGPQQGGAERMAPAGGARQGGPAAETKGSPGEKPAGRAAAEPPAGGSHPGAAKTEGKAGSEGKAGNEGKAGAAQNERAGEAGKKAPGQNAAGPNAPGKEGAREGGGKSVKVTSEQRTKIHTSIRSEHVESLRDVTFAVSVGTLVPERYRYHPLPPSIIEFVPEFRGYDYVLVGDEIIIIEPGTRRIVEIIE